MKTTTILTTTLLLTLSLINSVHSHGSMTEPRQRGMLNPDTQLGLKVLDPSAATDFCSHCNNGGGKAAVFSASGSDWQLYEPLKKGFKFTAGLCGDALKGPLAHQKGGDFYDGGKKVASYKTGSVIDVELAINAHHNGYSELYVCDLDSCGTEDIDEKCFSGGFCKRLDRVATDSCQGGSDKGCGPIDKTYPGRWYFPCKSGEPWQFFGGDDGKMKYQLPEGFTCKNCVVQWYWATANSCNPRGMKDYFEGDDKPSWGSCPGDGGSSGGYAAGSADCGGETSPEEFWGCADVSITDDGTASAVEPAAADEDEPAEEDKPDEEDKPAVESPAEEDKPAEASPAEEGSTVESPTEEKPAEESPAEEGSAVESPTEERPAEETPAEEGSAVESPAEEKPAEESPTEGSAVESPVEEDRPAVEEKDTGATQPETDASADNGTCAKSYNPCGGSGYDGPKECCSEDYYCKEINKWISLCDPKSKKEE